MMTWMCCSLRPWSVACIKSRALPPPQYSITIQMCVSLMYESRKLTIKGESHALSRRISFSKQEASACNSITLMATASPLLRRSALNTTP